MYLNYFFGFLFSYNIVKIQYFSLILVMFDEDSFALHSREISPFEFINPCPSFPHENFKILI